MAETWVINESPNVSNNLSAEISFESNGQQYLYFYIYELGYQGWDLQRGIDYGVPAYGVVSGWSNQAYRNITFDTAPTGDLLTWLEANGTLTPPATGYSITYHANGGTPEPENLTGQTNLPSPLPTVSKPNYTFGGWYTDSTFQTPAVAGAEISADTDLYAKFTRTHITLDLSNIGLPEGTHSIQMKLSGGDKRDGALSNAVIYTVSTWEYPVQVGDELTITQAKVISQSGDTLTVE